MSIVVSLFACGCAELLGLDQYEGAAPGRGDENGISVPGVNPPEAGPGDSLPPDPLGSAKQGGVGKGPNPGPVPGLDAGVPDAATNDAATNDAATNDAGEQNALRCPPSEGANCDVLVAALAHRYSFDGTGNDVVDSAGTGNGSLVNGQLTGSGAVQLSGSADAENYVNLPNGLVSSLSSATLEVWVTWAGGNAWQRIFDFGSSQSGEDQRGGGVNYLFLTPSNNYPTPGVTLAFRSTNPDTNGELIIAAGTPLASGVEEHVAVVINGTSNTLALFVDGAAAGSIAFPSQLSALDDVNSWLGRSQFDLDAPFAGSISEFRIYDVALSDAQVALSFELGPDAPLSP